MPSFRQHSVDAVAVALVGIGLAGAARGYLHNLPAPTALIQPDRDGPLTTGSIGPSTTQTGAAEPVESGASRPWTDPPSRTFRLSRYRPS